MLSPLAFLLCLVALTALAAGLSQGARRKNSRALAALARQWQMRFLPDDRFHLAPRVAHGLPVPGAADVVVKDLIYGQDDESALRYFFTVEYTTGVLRGKRRHVAAATLTEAPAAAVGEGYSPVTLAPAHRSLVAQYEHLKQTAAAPAPVPVPAESAQT
jgi:hypothetical protein